MIFAPTNAMVSADRDSVATANRQSRTSQRAERNGIGNLKEAKQTSRHSSSPNRTLRKDPLGASLVIHDVSFGTVET